MLHDLANDDDAMHRSDEEHVDKELEDYDSTESPFPMSDSDSGSERTIGEMPSAPNGGSLTLPVPSVQNGRASERGSGSTLRRMRRYMRG
jgi:hypothetical protein